MFVNGRHQADVPIIWHGALGKGGIRNCRQRGKQNVLPLPIGFVNDGMPEECS